MYKLRSYQRSRALFVQEFDFPYEQFIKMIVEERKKRRLTQKDLSRMICQDNNGYISRVESGKIKPGPEYIVRISKALRLTKRLKEVIFMQKKEDKANVQQ